VKASVVVERKAYNMTVYYVTGILFTLLLFLQINAEWNTKDYMKREQSLIKPYQGEVQIQFSGYLNMHWPVKVVVSMVYLTFGSSNGGFTNKVDTSTSSTTNFNCS
jgi:hypothetical protein